MRILSSLIVFFISFSSFSQIENVSKFLEVGISPLAYKGDLSQGYQKWTSAFHLGLKRNAKKTLNGHFNLMIGKIGGQNPNYNYESSTPNLFFSTTVAAVNYDVQLNLIKKKNFILYISQGIGLMRFNVKDENNDNLSDKYATRAKNETYNNISFIFPQSIGLMYFLPNNYGAGLQVGRLVPTTDYLDNISKLSTYKKPDNVLMVKFYFIAPLSNNLFAKK